MESTQRNPARTPKRRRRIWFVLLALAIGGVVSLLLLELAFRLFWQLPPWFAEFQQAGMYVAAADGAPILQAGYAGTLQIGDARQTEVTINNLGMRGADLPSKRAGEQRLLVLGDSMVFGYGVEDQQALPAALEQALLSEQVVSTVGNGGVPGYGSRHYVQHMQRLDATFEPDALVICGCLGNDAIDDTSPFRTVYAGLMLHGGFARTIRTSTRMQLAFRSRAALWVEAWLVSNKVEWSLLASLLLDPEDVLLQAGLPPRQQQAAGLFLDIRDASKTWQAGTPPVVPRLCGYLEDSLRSAKQFAAGRPLVYVILPTAMQTHAERRAAGMAKLGFAPADYEVGLAQQRWLQAARNAGVLALDATEVLQAAGSAEELYIEDGGHLSVRGNQVVAAWLAKQLAPLLR